MSEEVKVYHLCTEHDLYDGPHSIQISPTKDILYSKEVVLKSDFDALKKENEVLKKKLEKIESFRFSESDFEKTMFELPIVPCRKANIRFAHFIEDLNKQLDEIKE